MHVGWWYYKLQHTFTEYIYPGLAGPLSLQKDLILKGIQTVV